MWENPYIMTNKNGIVGISAISTTATSTAQVFTFRSHRFLNSNFRGLILVKLPSYTAPSSALPIQFTSEGGNTVTLTNVGGTSVTTTNLPSAGVYLCWVEGNTVQLLSRTA